MPSIWFLDKKTGKRCALNVYQATGIPSEIYCSESGAPVNPPDAAGLVHFTLEP